MRCGGKISCALAIALLWGGGRLSAQETSEAPDTYALLVEPSIADDGKISPAERAAILTTAHRVLAPAQLPELERRMEPYLEKPSLLSVGTWLAPKTEPAQVVPLADAPPVAQRLDDAGGLDGLWWQSPEGGDRLFDNVSWFLGLDGAKQPQDLGINANFGGRGSVNWGVPLWREAGLGLQVGTACVWSDNAVQVLRAVQGTGSRYQNFTTVGVFQRTNFGLVWGLGYDYLFENYYDNYNLGQWRAVLGYRLSNAHEVGVWATKRDRSQTGSFTGLPVTLMAINQTNVYWKYTWQNWAETMVWCGVANHHSNDVWVFPPSSPRMHPFIFGAQLNIPLSERISLFGQANFITPASSGTVDAFLGFSFYPRGPARYAEIRRFAPVLPVAGSPTFAVDMAR